MEHNFLVRSTEMFRNKWNSAKGSPVFPAETSQWKICVPFTDFYLSPVLCLLRSFKRPGSLVFNKKWRLITASFFGSFLQRNFQGYYECSAGYVLAPNPESLLQHECVAYKSGR